MKVGALAERIARHDRAVSPHQGMVILDSNGRPAGIITGGDILPAPDLEPLGTITVLDAGSRAVVVNYPDEVVHEASVTMLRPN
jgi:CBS domain-containing protein